MSSWCFSSPRMKAKKPKDPLTVIQMNPARVGWVFLSSPLPTCFPPVLPVLSAPLLTARCVCLSRPACFLSGLPSFADWMECMNSGCRLRDGWTDGLSFTVSFFVPYLSFPVPYWRTGPTWKKRSRKGTMENNTEYVRIFDATRGWRSSGWDSRVRRMQSEQRRVIAHTHTNQRQILNGHANDVSHCSL